MILRAPLEIRGQYGRARQHGCVSGYRGRSGRRPGDGCTWQGRYADVEVD